MTHTYAMLEVTPQTFNEIRRLLDEVSYPVSDELIDMNGIALTVGDTLLPKLKHWQGCCVCDEPAEFWCRSWRIPLCREHAHKDQGGNVTDTALEIDPVLTVGERR